MSYKNNIIKNVKKKKQRKILCFSFSGLIGMLSLAIVVVIVLKY